MVSLKQINTLLTVVGTAATTFEIMMKTFKWYEKTHKKKDKKEDLTRPIVKGLMSGFKIRGIFNPDEDDYLTYVGIDNFDNIGGVMV